MITNYLNTHNLPILPKALPAVQEMLKGKIAAQVNKKRSIEIAAKGIEIRYQLQKKSELEERKALVIQNPDKAEWLLWIE